MPALFTTPTGIPYIVNGSNIVNKEHSSDFITRYTGKDDIFRFEAVFFRNKKKSTTDHVVSLLHYEPATDHVTVQKIKGESYDVQYKYKAIQPDQITQMQKEGCAQILDMIRLAFPKCISIEVSDGAENNDLEIKRENSYISDHMLFNKYCMAFYTFENGRRISFHIKFFEKYYLYGGPDADVITAYVLDLDRTNRFFYAFSRYNGEYTSWDTYAFAYLDPDTQTLTMFDAPDDETLDSCSEAVGGQYLDSPDVPADEHEQLLLDPRLLLKKVLPEATLTRGSIPDALLHKCPRAPTGFIKEHMRRIYDQQSET